MLKKPHVISGCYAGQHSSVESYFAMYSLSIQIGRPDILLLYFSLNQNLAKFSTGLCIIVHVGA